MSTLSADDPRHGTNNGYGNCRCRCRLCTDAASAYAAKQRANRAQRGLPQDDPRHGIAHTYTNWGCRCSACTEAWRIDHLERTRRRRQSR